MAAGDGALEGEGSENMRRVVGASPRHNPDKLKIRKGPDNRKCRDDGEERHEKRQGNTFKLDPRGSAVNIRGLVQRMVDGLKTGQQADCKE